MLAQDWPSFDVIAIDDRSTDDTGRDPRCDRSDGSAADRSSTSRPAGCRRVGWASVTRCTSARARHDGQWLFFVDSDVTIAHRCADERCSSLCRAQVRRPEHPHRLECNSFLERLMLPPLAASWIVMHAVSLTNEDSQPAPRRANGQFFLIRRERVRSGRGT